jgi:transposase
MLLTSRKLLQRKLLDLESDLRGTLRNFGLKVGVVGRSRYEVRVRELVAGFPRLAAIAEPLLAVRRVMRQQLAVLHKMLLDTVRGDPVCRRLMTAPGVGAVVALTYRATVDQPQSFVHSRAVGAHVGLTPKRYQSGEVDYDGGVSKCGDALLRTMLYEAAHSMLTHSGKWSWLKAWGIRVAQRRGMRRAIVAVARRLAVCPAPDVGRWHPVPLEEGQCRGSCGCLNPENPGRLQGRRQRVLPRQKDVLTGTTGGVSS